MKPDLDWITQKYDEFNRKYFDGVLNSCDLECRPCGSRYLGYFTIQGENLRYEKDSRRIFLTRFDNSRMYIDYDSFDTICAPLIVLNTNYEAPESAWKNTLIHEMCHYYTYMDGYIPKQGHWREFKDIARQLYDKTNGEIVITTYDATGDFVQTNQKILQKAEKRQTNRVSNTFATLVITSNKELLLRMFTEPTLKTFLHFCKDEIIYCSNPDLITRLFDLGYNRIMRKLTIYWSITNPQIIDILNEYQFFDRNGNKAPSVKYLIGQDDDHIDDDENNNEVPLEDEWHLGYKIIRDDEGFNLVNNFGKKALNFNADSIIFDENKQLFIMKFGNFTKIGKPGEWKNVENESLNRHLKSIIREAIRNEMNLNNNDDEEDETGEIIPGMNLSLHSPYEF